MAELKNTAGPFSVFVVEDVVHIREKIIEYVLSRRELHLAGFARDGEEALEKLSAKQCDLLLVDVNLPNISGVELLEQLDVIPHIIFITAYDQYAVRAFELGALDYILKPFTEERFNQSIDRFIENAETIVVGPQKPFGQCLSFRENGSSYVIPYQDIIYITSSGKRTVLHTTHRDFEAMLLMKELEEKIISPDFIRIHKQYIVNCTFVSFLHLTSENYMLHLKDEDDTSLPVGRSYINSVRECLGAETQKMNTNCQI